jgi:very-short-patch-repair endonuclease
VPGAVVGKQPSKPFDIVSKVEAWRTQLLDLTKRNRLINFKSGRTGGVALVHPDPSDLWHGLIGSAAGLTFAWKRDLIELPPDPEDVASDALTVFDPTEVPEQKTGQDILERCHHSPRLRDNHLLTELPDRLLAGRLTRLALNSRESLTEQGVTTLYVAFGFLRWFESPDSQVEIRSPLLLVPVRLERDTVASPWKLLAEDVDILPNHTIAQLLAKDFRLKLPIPDDDADTDDPTWRTSYFAEVQRCIRDQYRWEVLDEVALGTFSFQKLAMWDDLTRNCDRIATHDLCRAVAGDSAVELRCPAGLPKPEDLDRELHPAQTFHILDADSSQHEAIVAATRGASLVLDGPPGTGKSQTIANIIAEFLAVGKTVLFVSEKAAALEVVQRRLQDRNLADFCLACHSHKANKRDVVAELGRCLGLVPEKASDPTDGLQRLHEARRQLNDYVRELHAQRPPLGMTVYQVHGELARARLRSASRCPIPNVLERDAAYLRHVSELLAGLAGCRGVITDRERHPWRGCRLTVFSIIVRDDVRHHFGRLAVCLDQAGAAAVALRGLGFCVDSPTPAQWRVSVGSAHGVLACPPVPASWFRGAPKSTAEAVVRLDELTKTYQRTLAGLPEFAPDRLRHTDGNALAAMSAAVVEPHLILRLGETVKLLRERLTSLDASLRELHNLATSVGQAARRIGALLRLTLPAQPVMKLHNLAELANCIARMGPVPHSWWDAGRRQELLAVISRCQADDRTARAARSELAVRLAPRAFAPESAGLAIRASSFRSSLSRVLPQWWWSVKPAVSRWYVEDVPSTTALLEDMGTLATYHRRIDYCWQVREEYAADLAPDERGDPDWDRTLEDLRSVDHLARLTKIPPTLRATLSTNDGLDRRALAAASKELGEHDMALRHDLHLLAQDYDLAEVTDAASGHVRLTTEEFAAWLKVQVDAVGRRILLLEQVIGLLVDGEDLPVAALHERVRCLADLGKLRSPIRDLCERIWPTEPPQDPEERDWSTLRKTAEALLRLLGEGPDPLPPAVVRVLTVPQDRARLTEAVRQSEAACAAGFEESWQFLAGLFDVAQPVSTGIIIEVTPLAELRRWLIERVADAHRIHEWTQFREIERNITHAGVAPILAEVLNGQVKPEEAGETFRARFFGLWLDALYERVPILRQFATDTHERLIERFRDLDRRSVASAAARVRAFQLSRPERPRLLADEAPGSSELGTLLREVHKKRRHLPLRKLFAAIPSLLLRLKPCVMMSPLSVSTYLHAPEFHFDLVIFDEASQVRPHDAICAISRGRRLVVAGDEKQLPPTSFFDRDTADEAASWDEDEGDDGLTDFESILTVCRTLGLPRRRLRWHYRSRREGLIAFANQSIYANELVTFPSVEDAPGNPAVAFDYIPTGRWKAGPSGGFNAIEARHTAELVLAHFRNHPDESLGVIAFSQRQQLCVQDALEQLRKTNPDLEQFFGEDQDEPFFVKNLENVQGDEREVIFLAIGYGPDETGRVALRFGPLNRQGGERRLNVAVTRARQRMTVVSSMHAHDIDLSRTRARGVELLRAYLDYAERGAVALTGAISGVGGQGFDSPFEQEVYEELSRRGLTVHPQVGCSAFRIDLAIVDPKTPSRYLLGVECDGATYHSSATARDRDRLRQEVLESLGWHICRIWSTDWLRDRDNQVQRVRAALEKAQREGVPAPQVSVPSKPEQPTEVQPPQAGAGDVTKALSYQSIEDVPEPTLREVVCRLLRTCGATDEGDLIAVVARQLGFQRVGKRIHARIKACLESLARDGQVGRTADQRLHMAPSNRAASM